MKTKMLGILTMSLALAACGGGGGGTSTPPSSSTPQNVNAPAPVTSPAPDSASADMSLAARLYKGDERTPTGFDLEERPASVTGTLSTRHLRNTDFATGPQAAGPVFEVCTNDMAQAIAWSETLANWHGQYSDLAEVRGDDQIFEIVRVPRADATAMLRHRVFKCDYLDRSGSDLRADAGSAGAMNQRPLTAEELEALAEYLWQFTVFNNADFAVESSSSAVSGNQLVHTIRMGQLVRGVNGACDNVQIVDWTHTMDGVTGGLSRSLSNVRTFKSKGSQAGAETCAG
jgi:hypothetical protein